MSALINGLARFLNENNDSCALLAFRSANYETYLSVLNGIEDGHLKDLLNSSPRVRIEPGFVPQKWILQQPSINVFISHCGMGSALESLYFSKPILCMPFNMEQFSNALSIVNLGVGLSLFVPPSIWTSLRNPYDFVHYTFSAARVTESMLALWTQPKYTKAATLMSLEMKNAGGVRRAVQEIEFFVQLNGNVDRYAPFQSTLPFYQTMDARLSADISHRARLCHFLLRRPMLQATAKSQKRLITLIFEQHILFSVNFVPFFSLFSIQPIACETCIGSENEGYFPQYIELTTNLHL